MNPDPSGGRGRPRERWLLALLLLGEFLLFDQFGSHRHTWIWPRWNDQIQYLTESYTGYEYLRIHGWFAGLWHSLINPSAQGTLHDFYAILLFSVTGPSRSAALAVNMLALIAWQVSLFLAVRRVSSSRTLAWVAVFLPLALRYPFSSQPGSMADFRLDHLAMCTFGICLSCALVASGVRQARTALLFGLAVGLTLLTRFLTGTYFLLIFAGFLAAAPFSPGRGKRCGHLLLAAAVAAVVAGPVFWLNRDWIWNYYVIGHFIGPESALRNPHMGLGRSLDFVGSHLAREQLGTFFFLLAGGATAGLVLWAWRRRASPDATPPAPGARFPVGPGLAFLAAPAIALTLHQQKSEVVLGVLVPGVLALLLALWSRLLAGCGEIPGRWLAGGVALLAGGFFVFQQFTPAYDENFLRQARLVNQLADEIYRKSLAAGLAAPSVGVDQVTDYFDAQVLRVICYERQHRWVPFIMTLPTGIAESEEKVLMERVQNSDFIFLTESGPPGGWPYDRQMRALLPRTKAWCDDHLRVAERFEIFDRRMVLYQRPNLP
jgi:hypothetical protein